MELLHHGVDQSVIALWLGHASVETTQVYVHADLAFEGKGARTDHSSDLKPMLPARRHAACIPRIALTMPYRRAGIPLAPGPLASGAA